MKKLDEFTQAYIICALWSTNDESNESGGDPLDANYGIDDLHVDTLMAMIADCFAFQRDNAKDLENYPIEHAGHDFWLTRNGHGCGFWENDYGTEEECERLTEASHKFGDFELYVGDDGKIYH